MIEWYLETETDPEVTSCHLINEYRPYLIGRKRGLDIITTNPLVSRNHGLITLRHDNSIYIRDTYSSNGIWINNNKIPSNADFLLQRGDLIGIGGPATATERPELYRLYYRNVNTENESSMCNQINNDKAQEELEENQIILNMEAEVTDSKSIENNSNHIINCEEIDKENSLDIPIPVASLPKGVIKDISSNNNLKKIVINNINNIDTLAKYSESKPNNNKENTLNLSNTSTSNIIKIENNIPEPAIIPIKNNCSTIPSPEMKPNVNDLTLLPISIHNDPKTMPAIIEIVDSDEEMSVELEVSPVKKTNSIKGDLSENSFTEIKTEHENNSYSFTQDNVKEIAETISDDEDMFPHSQLFDDIKIEAREEDEETIMNENVQEINSDADQDDDSIFANIKKEVEENVHHIDDEDQNEDDDEDDCRIWIKKLSQQQDIISCSQEFDRIRKNTVNDDDEDCFPQFDDNELDIIKTKNINEESRGDVTDIFDTLKDLHINFKLQNDKTGATSEISDEDHLEERKDKKSSEVKTSTNDKWYDKSKKRESKKTYIKPPVIDAPYLRKGKRKANEESTKSHECKIKKRKPEEEHPSTSASASTSKCTLNISVRTELKKRNKKRRKSVDSMSKNEKQQIINERKKKLKEIAQNKHEQKIDEKVPKPSTKPKVKVSNSRGLFLTDDDLKMKHETEKKCTKEKKNHENKIKPERSSLDKKIKYKIRKIDNDINTVSSSKTNDKKQVEQKNLNRLKSIDNPEEQSSSTSVKIQSADQKNTTNLSKSLDHHTSVKRKESTEQKNKTDNMSKPRLLKSILKGKIYVKKLCRVHFNDKVDTKIFEKDELQSEPPIVTHNLNNDQISIVNEVIIKILNWLPIWLQEQKRLECCPPNLADRAPLKMFYHFNNSRDYYNIVMPLMLMELWRSIFKDWCSSSGSSKSPTILGSVDDLGHVAELNNNICLYCHSLTIKGKPEINIYRGDLAIVEIMLNNDKQASNSVVGVATKFGYIKDVQRKRLSKTDTFNGNLVFRTQIPEYKISYTLLIKTFSERLCDRRLIRIRIVSRIDPPLRLFRSVSFLEKSPLCNFILKPTVKDYIVAKPTQHIQLALADKLNREQVRCVYEACQVCTRDEPGIYLIQGPPGTGKSLVIKNIVRQLIYGQRKKIRILVCAPSNGAIDEIACRLLDMRGTFAKNERFKMIRLGPPNSITNNLVRLISVPELIRKHILSEQINSIHNNDLLAEQYNSLLSKINKIEHKVSSMKQRQENTNEEEMKLKKAKEDLVRFKSIDRSFQEKRKQEKILEEYYIENADIICSTLSSCMSYRMEELYRENKIKLNCCLIDEATQSNEQENLIPLMLGINKFVLVGDPQQLPPTILSQEAKKLGYGNSLFHRIQHNLEHLSKNPIRMLKEQYRMHPEICQFPSAKFYGGKLRNSEPVLKRMENILYPYRVFAYRSSINNSESEYINKSESNLILLLANIVLKKTKYNIGIVTPYTRQKELLLNILKQSHENKEDLNLRVVVNTIDGFQGQEKDVIIISCCRIKLNGFISDIQRLNVALTRAKYATYICAHAHLFESDSVWNQIEANASKRNMIFYVNDAEVAEEHITPLICK